MFWLFLIVLIDGIGFGIIIPLLPLLAIHFSLSGFELGLLTASFAFFQLITSPFLGALSDKYGRRLIILVCLFSLSISYVLLAYATTFTGCLIARCLAGLFTGNISVVLAAAADLSTPKNSVKNMGIVGGATGIGFIIGPSIGGFLAGDSTSASDFKLVFTVAALATFLAFILAVFFLKKNLPIKKQTDNILRQVGSIFSKIMQDKEVLFLFILSVLMWFAFSALYLFLATWSIVKFDLTPKSSGMLGTLFAVFTAIVQVLSYKIIQGTKALMLGFVVTMIAVLSLILDINLIFFCLAVVTLAIGLGILYPNINSSITENSEETQRGVILGGSQSAGMLGQTLGPILIGLIYTNDNPQLAWLAIAFVLLLGIFLVIMHSKKTRKL